MSDWKDYEYGCYRINDGWLIFHCYSWKPMVPKGFKIDYSSWTNVELYSEIATHSESDVNYYEVVAKLKCE